MLGNSENTGLYYTNAITFKNVMNACVVHGRVLNALILRETKTRYGEHKLGFVWALLEPILMIAVMYVVFTAMGSTVGGGMHIALFMISGFIPFMIFRDTMSQSQGAIQQNTSLLGFPQVSTYDLILARALLELSVLLSVFGILMISAGVLGVDVRCENPLGVLAACGLIWVLALGFGFIFASLSRIVPSTRQFTSQIMGRPLLLTSGIFYTAESIPSGIREYMLYNPVLHMVELTRSEYFYEFHSDYGSWSYASSFAFCTLAFGLTVHRAMKKRAIIGI